MYDFLGQPGGHSLLFPVRRPRGVSSSTRHITMTRSRHWPLRSRCTIFSVNPVDTVFFFLFVVLAVCPVQLDISQWPGVDTGHCVLDVWFPRSTRWTQSSFSCSSSSRCVQSVRGQCLGAVRRGFHGQLHGQLGCFHDHQARLRPHYGRQRPAGKTSLSSLVTCQQRNEQGVAVKSIKSQMRCHYYYACIIYSCMLAAHDRTVSFTGFILDYWHCRVVDHRCLRSYLVSQFNSLLGF